MSPALRNIATYITHFTEAIATITGVDIEVIDTEYIRVAGTGSYSFSVGDSIKSLGEIYNYTLTHHETVFIEHPKEHALCQPCKHKDSCQEKLTFCTPIIVSGQVIGLIGLVCFTEQDRERIIANRDIYIYFFRQIADGIARVAENERSTQKLRRSMEMLLKVTNSNDACVLVLDVDNRISFINDAARSELGIHPGEYFHTVGIVDVSGKTSGEGEFEIKLTDAEEGGNARPHVVLGRMFTLSKDDLLYNKALVFDSKQRIAEFFSTPRSESGDHDALQAIIGRGPAITALKDQILKTANAPSTVLITGESGTGKEMVARAVHAMGNRADGPFIALNCGAIPDTLLESELFGYVGGAFTGASAGGRMGKFELADKGVLFLDEISSMSLYLQVKLLRVLQERSFSRLGSNKTASVDIRVIAASNELLPELIAQRMFREDLYYRLNVIPIDIPPLRERPEDIPVLADYFFAYYCRLFNKAKGVLAPSLVERLLQLPWRGNIREFENCFEYMVNMYDTQILDASCLPAKLAAELPHDPALPGTSSGPEPRPFFPGHIVPLAEMEQLAIKNALDIFGTSAEAKRKAALALGISTATLYRKLKGGG